MKHKGKARRAALKLILLTLAVVLAVGALGFAKILGGVLLVIASVLAVVWFLFTIFTLYFFRDPDPNTPPGPGQVVSPGHGKVDVVEKIADSQYPGGPCHRISIFLSVIDIHVQNAPIAGRIASVTHAPGQFLSALKLESAMCNENVLIGFDSAETPGEKIGARLIAGVLARRIVPFVTPGDDVQRGQRISLIQFGSRCDLYLPLHYNVKVKPGDRVVGGETVMASKS